MAGVAAAYFLERGIEAGAKAEVVLFEASERLGGIVETVREGGFVVECGPDAWVTEKPWALELAQELGLGDEVMYSLDAERKTYIRLDGRLEAMPDGMRMMVPGDLAAMEASTLFSQSAKRAFREEVSRAAELRAAAPGEDESVASFVARHFGGEVLERIAAPLLSGVFGGNVRTLSVRSVMPAFVTMERTYGSLILAVQAISRVGATRPVFTTLRSGLGTLIERMVARIPERSVRLRSEVNFLERTGRGWLVGAGQASEEFDEVLIAAPVDVARRLLEPVESELAEQMEMEASSAVVVAFCYDTDFELPPGFGFLVPPGHGNLLLACTFTDQKFNGRVPQGGRLVRAFFGGAAADRLIRCGNDEIAAVARLELSRILGPMPEPIRTLVRRWPKALPQYAVGHLERMAEVEERVRRLGGLWLLGNGYRGVGLPDLIRDARFAAVEALGTDNGGHA